MDKLQILRKFLLESALNLKAANLHCFAEKGAIKSCYNEYDKSFSIQYDANIIITDFNKDFNKDFKILAFLMSKWVDENQPENEDEDIIFHVDVLDHKKSDISFVVSLNEDICVNTVAGGLNLQTLSENNVHKLTFFDINS